jgi:hypothetical protein
MLAVTHHVIVRYSALMCGIESFRDYALLGDDIVIANDLVAEQYLKVMETLGVSINLSKSVISKDFAEFARVLRGPDSLDYSPLGAGLILRLMKDNTYLGAVMSEMFKVHVFKHYGACLKMLQKLPVSLRSAKSLAL